MAIHKTVEQSYNYSEDDGSGSTYTFDNGIAFKAKRVPEKPTNIFRLRNSDYGSGFRMPTTPELIPLINFSLQTRETEISRLVLLTLRKNWLTGNTRIIYTNKGMFVQDNFPNLTNLMTQRALESKLQYEEKGVMFGDNRAIRFVPYGFKTGDELTPSQLAVNCGIIALTGSLENADELAKISTYWTEKLGFFPLINTNSEYPKNRFPCFGSDNFDGRLIIAADGKGTYLNRRSFGIKIL